MSLFLSSFFIFFPILLYKGNDAELKKKKVDHSIFGRLSLFLSAGSSRKRLHCSVPAIFFPWKDRALKDDRSLHPYYVCGLDAPKNVGRRRRWGPCATHPPLPLRHGARQPPKKRPKQKTKGNKRVCACAYMRSARAAGFVPPQ